MGFQLCFAFLVVVAVFAAACAAAAAGDGGGALMEMEERLQNGSAGERPPSLEVGDDNEEWALPSETARRFLDQSGDHITYNTLNANQPAGGSGKSGEPYSRGCSTAYNCKP